MANANRSKGTLIMNLVRAAFGLFHDGRKHQFIPGPSGIAIKSERASAFSEAEAITQGLIRGLTTGTCTKDDADEIVDYVISVCSGSEGQDELQAFLRRLRQEITGGPGVPLRDEVGLIQRDFTAYEGTATVDMLADQLLKGEDPVEVEGCMRELVGVASGAKGPEAQHAFVVHLREVLQAPKEESNPGRQESTVAGDIVDPASVAEIEDLKSSLKTEKDGREYAVAMLEALEAEASLANENGGRSPFNTESEEADVSGAGVETGTIGIYRVEAQSASLAIWTGRLYKYASPEAVRGFYVVWTDWVGAVIDGGVPDAAECAEREKQDLYEPWGTVNYSHPELAKAAIEAGEYCYHTKPARQSEAGTKKSGASKRNTKQTDADKKAAAILSRFTTQVYALDDMARRFARIPLSAFTTYQTVKGICFALEDILDEATAAAPERHKVRKVILGIRPMIYALSKYIHHAYDSAGEWAVPKETIGVGMLALVQAIGREFERAQISCGEPEITGYLTGDDSDPNAVEK